MSIAQWVQHVHVHVNSVLEHANKQTNKTKTRTNPIRTGFAAGVVGRNAGTDASIPTKSHVGDDFDELFVRNNSSSLWWGLVAKFLFSWLQT